MGDAVCFLGMNNLYKKLYLIFGYWVVILMLLSVFGLVFRGLTFIPCFRTLLLLNRAGNTYNFRAIQTICNAEQVNSLLVVVGLSLIGDGGDSTVDMLSPPIPP